MPLPLKRAAETAYNLHFIEYPVGNYSELEAGLADLVADVTQYRIDHPN
jgi:hypothetical protein